MFALAIVFITLLTAALPYIVRQITSVLPSIKLHQSYNWLPVLAAVLFLGAWFIPDVHISKETTTFQQHFVGGGMYSACLYVYFKRLFGWKLHSILAVLVLFAWVSTFGVANELAEFTLTKLRLVNIDTSDTDWDLLANTLGALVGYVILRLRAFSL